MKKTKVISSRGQSKQPLTSKMIVALLATVESDDNKTGSLTELLNRGLIVQKEVALKNHKEFQWEVTKKGITILNNLEN